MPLKTRRYAIIILVLFTALLHLAAAVDRQLFPDGPDPLFILNGLGYLGLLGAYFLPIGFLQGMRQVTWWALFLYIIASILAWIVIWVGFNVIRDGVPFFAHDSLYGVPAKIAEVALLFLMWKDKPAAAKAK